MRPRGQMWFLEKRKNLRPRPNDPKKEKGYYVEDIKKGMCFGVALEGMAAFLADKMLAFNERYSMLEQYTADQLIAAIEENREKHKEWSKKAKDTLQPVFDSRWHDEEVRLKNEYKNPDELSAALLQEKIAHNKRCFLEIQSHIAGQKDEYFASNVDAKFDRQEFDALSELDAAAQTVAIHYTPQSHPELFPQESEIYLAEKLPDDLSKLNNAYYFIQASAEQALKFYHIVNGTAEELTIADPKKLGEHLEEKSIDNSKPLQQQYAKGKMAALWKAIAVQCDQIKIPKTLSQDPAKTLALLMPKELEDMGGIAISEKFSGSYTQSELTAYFASLKNSLSQSQPPFTDRVSLLLSVADHAITVGYEPRTDTWSLINANQLPRKISYMPKQIAEDVMEAFGCKNQVTLATQVGVLESKDNNFKPCLASWQKSPEWQAIHKPTAEKINQRDDRQTTWLYCAANEGLTETVTRLLEIEKVDPNIVCTKDGDTPLLVAIRDQNVDSINALLDHGANTNIASGRDGSTPIMIAAMFGREDIVATLLEHKADPNIKKTSDGSSTLMVAIQNNTANNKTDEIVKLLLAHPNIDPNQAKNNGETPLIIALSMQEKSMMDILLSHSAIDPNKPDMHGTPLTCAAEYANTDLLNTLLSHTKIKIDQANPDGTTALFNAVKNSRENAVSLLLDHKANPNLGLPNGTSPLFMAVYNGNQAIFERLLKADNIQLDPGATIKTSELIYVAQQKHCETAVRELLTTHHGGTIPDEISGLTPLHAAVFLGKNEMAKALIEHEPGADITRNAAGISLREFALAVGNRDFSEYIDSFESKRSVHM